MSVLLSETTSLCPTCKTAVPAKLFEENGQILMRKHCADHGAESVLIASDAAWYHKAMKEPARAAPPVFRHAIDQGCPYDCGSCYSHEQATLLPVIPITSACDLNCPICYTHNRNEDAYHISLAEFSDIIDALRRADPRLTLINLTGGEPTRHPQLLEIIRLCHQAGFHRVTISTHGLGLLHNEDLVAELARLQARIVLSFNSFNDEVNQRMVGASLTKAKLRVLDLLEKYDIATTLIPVLAMNHNDREIGELINLVLTRRNIRSLEIHTMTFTGQGGGDYGTEARLTTPDVLRQISLQTQGRINADDFLSSPCAHPLCYQTCYLLETEDDGFVPFARFIPHNDIRNLLTNNVYIEPGPLMEQVLQDAMTDLWANPDHPYSQTVLATLRQLTEQIFPSRPIPYAEQQNIAERAAKAIYIHAHMDEHNFDTDRIKQCCVAVPDAQNHNIPTCSYNILYRERDPRFASRPASPLRELGKGKVWKIMPA